MLYSQVVHSQIHPGHEKQPRPKQAEQENQYSEGNLFNDTGLEKMIPESDLEDFLKQADQVEEQARYRQQGQKTEWSKTDSAKAFTEPPQDGNQ